MTEATGLCKKWRPHAVWIGQTRYSRGYVNLLVAISVVDEVVLDSVCIAKRKFVLE